MYNKTAKAPKRVIVYREGMEHIFCPFLTTSIQIHNAFFCQSAEKKFNFNHLLPENTNIGCEKYYVIHWNGNFGHECYNEAILGRRCQTNTQN